MKRLTNKMIDKAIFEKDVKTLIDYVYHIAPKAKKIYHSYKNEYLAYENMQFATLMDKLTRCIDESIKINKRLTQRYYFINSKGREPKSGEILFTPHYNDFL